jgi:hypothetical protein
MDLMLASHLGEENEMILPGFKTTEPDKRNPNKKSKEKRMGQKLGCYNPTPLTKNLVLEIWLLREQV